MGWLNPTPEDEYRIQAMGQGGNTTTELPQATGFDGALSAIPKGIAAGVGKVGTMAQDALGNTVIGDDFRQFTSLTDQANDTFHSLLGYDPLAFNKEQRDASEAAATTIGQWSATGQDLRRTGVTGRMLGQAAEGMTIVAGAAPVAGPWGAAALYGGAEGDAGYQDALRGGLDPTTAKEMGALAGVASAAGAAIPVVGKSIMGKIVSSVLGNTALDVGGRATASAVLSANGYQAQADQERIFDSQSMLADAVMGAAFGLHSGVTTLHSEFAHELASVRPQDVNPADVDTSAAVLNQSHFERSAPGIPTDPVVATLHADTMTHALDSMLKGDEPTITEPVARELLGGMIPDPEHDLAPHILAAAREEIPQFNDAVDPVKQLPQEPVNDAAVSIDDLTAGDDDVRGRLSNAYDELMAKYPNMILSREDGTTDYIDKI
ncbi:MAG: hypothetical protein ABI858_02170, partial [Pseudoxanthomonas sp.]